MPAAKSQLLGFTKDWKTEITYLLSQDYPHCQIKVLNPKSRIWGIDEVINLCIPIKIDGNYFDQMIITAIEQDVITGELKHRTPLRYPLFVECDSLESKQLDENIVSNLLKDALITKKAILIYFQHLIPFFSKISLYGQKQHDQAMSKIEEDVLSKIKAKINLLEQYKQGIESEEQFLKDYLYCAQTEIDEIIIRQLFNAVSVEAYIKSIRLSEHKLAINYNTMTLVLSSGQIPKTQKHAHLCRDI